MNLMNRANSIKKAVRRVIEMTEEAFKKTRPSLARPVSHPCPPRISPHIPHKTVVHPGRTLIARITPQIGDKFEPEELFSFPWSHRATLRGRKFPIAANNIRTKQN